MPARLRVSLIATVLDEYGSLPAWTGGLADQSRLPDECIIVDGGSTDGTRELLASHAFPFPCRVMIAPGANISAGRNIAIEASIGDVVVVTDAGTRADRRWIERIVEPLERESGVDLVAGFFAPSAHNIWTETLGATTLPDAIEIDEDRFLPSSRSVAFRRRWCDAGFRYPEWLDYCEDLVFDMRLLRAGATKVTRLDAVVEFVPRGGLISFVRQYYRYARGDGKAGLYATRHIIRYATYLVGLGVLARRRPLEFMMAAVAGCLYLRRPVMRYRRRYPWRWSSPLSIASTICLIALQRLAGDVAKMAGYPLGMVWRWRTDRSLRFWKSGWKVRRPDGSLPGA